MENGQPQNKKKNPIKILFEKCKNFYSSRRFFIVVFILVIILVVSLPTIYKGLSNARNYIVNLFNSKSSYDKMICTQSVENNDYKTDLNVILFYDVNGLKKEDYTLTMKAISENGKNNLKERKNLYDELEQSYKKYEGFETKVRLRKDTFSFHLVTDHQIIDHDKINEEGSNETGEGVTVKLKLNQNIDSAVSYYESLGLTCKKK